MTKPIRCILRSYLRSSASLALAQEAKPAQPDIAAANQAVLPQLPFADRQDFEDAARGFIATIPNIGNQLMRL